VYLSEQRIWIWFSLNIVKPHRQVGGADSGTASPTFQLPRAYNEEKCHYAQNNIFRDVFNIFNRMQSEQSIITRFDVATLKFLGIDG
jgi:hypothetical protein